MKHASSLHRPLAVSLLALAVSSAWAAPLGGLRSVSPGQADGPSWDLVSDSGARVRVSLPRADVVRIQAGRKELTGPGDKAAPIVVATAAGDVKHEFKEENGQLVFRTDALTLRVDRKPLRFTLYRAGETQPLWRELQAIDLGDKQSVQVLSSDKAERFFGGGQQNGRFEFKGRELPVSYSGGWEEGDRPNPAPFLMSSRGWGMLRNSWADGNYDLREDKQLTLQHAEGRFDAYYFVGKSMHEVLARYTEWTGRARMLPRWALEYGDADCYNDGDNVKKPGTVPRGWTDGPTGKTPDVIDSVARKYREHDMPGGWILPNDGYGCGYTALPETVQGLAKQGFRTGLWTENGVDKIAWEVGQAGSRVQKLDVAWTGKGYQFSLDANKSAYDGILNNSDSRPFIWTVMGWAGTQRYAVAWTGDQSASWDYIRWHVPTLIGSGLSGQAYATGDVDAMVVVNRPAEEPGHPMENAFDGNPATWFRTVRSQAVKSGAHEWVIGFTERRLVDGIEIAPRSDANWKHGQVRDYEIYLADSNGEWGAPVKRGQLTLSKDVQTIAFPASAGRLLRFRVLSTQNPDGSGAAGTDPMVTAVSGGAAARAFDAAAPADVAPITLSEFRILEHPVPEGQELRRYLSELPLPKKLGRDKPAGKASEMRMNGLRFNRGVGMGPAGRLDLQLGGAWRLLRADLGVDDSCREAGWLRFQVWSGERLLYDSGLVKAPAVVKPEIDVRGLGQLSLRTLGATGAQPARTCGNWGNAVLIGTEGAKVKPR